VPKLTGVAKAKFLARINKGRVKAGLKKIHSKTKSVKRRLTKSRKSTPGKTKRTKSKNTRNKTVAKKNSSRKGTSMKTRLVKFGAGAGIGALIAILATALRRQEINATAPIIDAAAGVGVEGQVGTAIMRVGVPLITRAFRGNGNGMNSMGEGGA